MAVLLVLVAQAQTMEAKQETVVLEALVVVVAEAVHEIPHLVEVLHTPPPALAVLAEVAAHLELTELREPIQQALVGLEVAFPKH
jgi:hypothetical protein